MPGVPWRMHALRKFPVDDVKPNGAVVISGNVVCAIEYMQGQSGYHVREKGGGLGQSLALVVVVLVSLARPCHSTPRRPSAMHFTTPDLIPMGIQPSASVTIVLSSSADRHQRTITDPVPSLPRRSVV